MVPGTQLWHSSHVMDSWEQVRRIQEWEVAGILFQQPSRTLISWHRSASLQSASSAAMESCSVLPSFNGVYFEKCPPGQSTFGFPIVLIPTSPEVLTVAISHTLHLIQMKSTALGIQALISAIDGVMRTPNQHVRYGVKPGNVSIMGETLIHTQSTEGRPPINIQKPGSRSVRNRGTEAQLGIQRHEERIKDGIRS
jgi:hypothetical protein